MASLAIKDRYLDAAVARQYDRERFSSFAGRTFDQLEQRTLRSVVKRVRCDIADPVVLDIACGTGRITELLLDEGLGVIGGDISTAMLRVAQSRLTRFGSRVSFRELDLDRLSLENDSVDLVTCIRLLHHVDSPARAQILGELARVTRRFVIVNVSYSSPVYALRRRLKRALGQGVSEASSTWVEIQREASSAGLRIEDSRFVWPLMSEDLVLLLSKTSHADDVGRNRRSIGSPLGKTNIIADSPVWTSRPGQAPIGDVVNSAGSAAVRRATLDG